MSTILFNPVTDSHHCPQPRDIPNGTIFRCDECGQHWLYDIDIFGSWWRISERKASRLIRRARGRRS